MYRMLRSPSNRYSSSAATFAVALWTAVGAGLLALTPEEAQGQSAREILSRALDENSRRLAGIENLTIRQETMGITMTTYMEKEVVEGYPVLRPREVGALGMDMEDDSWEFLTDPRELYGSAAEHWTLAGRGSVDGRATWRLSIDGAHIPAVDDDPWDGDEGVFEAERMILELDQERLVPLRIEIDGVQGPQRSETTPIRIAMTFSDYRDVRGYLHPYLTSMEMTMGGDGPDPAELAEAREGLAEFRRQMEQLPPEHRQRMEEMMGEQIRMYEAMLAGETVTSEIRVTELLANQGPPER